MPRRKRRKRPEDWPNWFEPKGYPHFDEPIRDPKDILPLVESANAVARHGFLPFIHFSKKVRKYKSDPGGFVRKDRPLSYASHKDTQIYRRYSIILGQKYEQLLCSLGIEASVIAYRRFNPPKCNIHFANDAFRFIEQNSPCVAMAFDVKDFFESLDHRKLKQQWKVVLGVNSLPDDHYKVFRAITKYSKVDRDQLYAKLGITKKKAVALRGAICTPKQFREIVRTNDVENGLIVTKDDGKGVPQGSPISALLSNIYMLPVDTEMVSMVREFGGLYLRYSDDILVVCPVDRRTSVVDRLRTLIKLVDLDLHEGKGKSVVATFRPESGEKLASDRPFQYLGFVFDGRCVRVRSHTLARYFRRMRKAIRREKYISTQSAGQDEKPKVRRKLLYSRYSHLGTENFISYAEKAHSIIARSRINEQIKRHWTELHALLQIDE